MVVLSAVITRKNTQSVLWESMRKTKLLLERPANKPLHFRDLPHPKCVAWAKQIATLPQVNGILVHKPSLTEANTFNKKHQLYRYASKLLIERCPLALSGRK